MRTNPEPWTPREQVVLSHLAGFRLEGIERSIKLSPGRVARHRFLAGIEAHEMPAAQLEEVCASLGMPPAHRERLKTLLGDANQILFGFEESQDAVTLKVYLEFWDRVRQEAQGGDPSPRLLHLGLKSGWTTRQGHSRAGCRCGSWWRSERGH